MDQNNAGGITERSVKAALALGVLAAIIYLATVQGNEAAVGGLIGALLLVRDYFSRPGSPS